MEKLEAEEEELAQAREERLDQVDMDDVQSPTLETKVKGKLRELYQVISKSGGFNPDVYFYDVDKDYEEILRNGMPLPEVLQKLDAIIAKRRRERGHR